jgi:adenosine deaminase
MTTSSPASTNFFRPRSITTETPSLKLPRWPRPIIFNVELMHTADDMDSAQLGARLGWDDDFGHMREGLLSGGLKDVVSSTLSTLDQDETKMRSLLHCGTAQARAGCDVTIRYLYQVLRGLPKESVFAEIVLGFELASADARFVGLNLVMPEDWYVPMRDFDLHMRMLDYLHGLYPKVHITLHAGELAVGLVAPDGLTFHIRESSSAVTLNALAMARQ